MSAQTTTQGSFLLPFAAFVLTCAVVMALVFRGFDLNMGLPEIGVLSYFTVLTFVLHTWQERALATDPKRFVHRFMAGLVIKMMASLVLLLVLLLTLPKEGLIPFAISFAALYLAFLVFSTTRSLRLMRRMAGK